MVDTAMTEVRKSGADNKVASVLYVFQLKTRTVSHLYFYDIFAYFVYPQQFENWSGIV